MTDHDDVLDALRPLSGPTVGTELAGLTADVGAMIAAFPIALEPHMNATSSRRKTIATLLIAGVIGFGGVTAAGPGGFDVLAPGSATDSTTSSTRSGALSTPMNGIDGGTTTWNLRIRSSLFKWTGPESVTPLRCGALSSANGTF